MNMCRLKLFISSINIYVHTPVHQLLITIAFAQRSILKYQSVWKHLTPGRLLLLTAKGRKWEVGALLESTTG